MSDLPAYLVGFVDDQGLIPDRASLPVHDSPAVGCRVCHQGDLDSLVGRSGLRVTVDGAGGMPALARAAAGPFGIVAATVRLQDPGDPVANVRRFLVAARDADLPEDVLLHVEVQGPPLGSWLSVADEVAAVEGALVLDLDAGDPASPEVWTEAWIEAALDRELPFVLSGGSIGAALDTLATTARLWGDADDLVAARRWCRSWQTRDVPAALTYLEGLS
ncbi:hypothetical protein [Nocardioides plantarum]|uniref:Uncharacterized protein n=1 Tax=Nocardioides plantarum TaxID=29299 RepID=A0ABV5KFB7_9ACTN|nr:hypothetical protein [Nocardioides plantarum]